MTISPASGPIGTRVSVVGTCHPGAKVPWFFGVPNSDGGPGIVRGDVTAASTGRFTITFTVPPDVDPKLPSVVGAYCADADPDPSTPIVEAQDNFTITTATAVVTNPPSPDHPVAATPHFTG
jgi:hypothetical protein